MQFKVEGGDETKKDGREDDEADFSDDVGRLAQLDCVRTRLLKVCETQGVWTRRVRYDSG